MLATGNTISSSLARRLGAKGENAWKSMEAWFDPLFGQTNNPWRQLGALSYYYFWIIVITGCYLFAVFDTSVAGAYRSIDYLSHEQWWLGGIMRSLHRYASDAFALTMLLHLARELVHGRFRGFRIFSWLTGLPLLWLVYAAGINGYWLVWDSLAQHSVIATSEWLDWLPIFSEPIVRNFLTPEGVNDRFFSLTIFLHIGLPLFSLLFMYIHIQRISQAKTFPPKVLAWGSFAALLVLSLIKPAMNQAPADMSMVPINLDYDWFYLGIFPLMYQTSPAVIWLLLGGITLFLVILPWSGHRQVVPVAVVNPANCNGCGRCVNDCPYAAVSLVQRVDGRTFKQQALVDSDLCAACGICAGSCPSSTPFRTAAVLNTGIDMPQLRVDSLRVELEEKLAALEGDAKVIVFGCDHAADVAMLKGPGVLPFSLICTAQLPPSFIEYALRNGADGVMVTGCREGDCEFRLGTQWVNERLTGERQPHLRRSVSPGRVRVMWHGSGNEQVLRSALEDFRTTLRTLPTEIKPEPRRREKERKNA
jgi:coenzyme F420-reducing hydrogenase delta subunit/quinol-cytochrome oxidoreductase complex cytochrome b subunit